MEVHFLYYVCILSMLTGLYLRNYWSDFVQTLHSCLVLGPIDFYLELELIGSDTAGHQSKNVFET